jgi:GTPase
MKSGILTLAGRSNSGKSTLLNALIDTKAAITSPKPQTTRSPIRGILTDDRGQIVIIDAPGIFESASGPLTSVVNAAARDALRGVDAIGYVVDPTRNIGVEEHRIHTLVRSSGVPFLLILNKSDLRESERPHEGRYHDLVALDPSFRGSISVSALKQQHLIPLKSKLFEMVPEGELMYPATQRVDVAKEFWIAEIIREKIFLVMHEEIPYAATVVIDDISEERENLLRISARILTTHERYRRMLIGRGAQRVKQIGQMSRKELEPALQTKIMLELHVVVDKKWAARL